MTHFAKRLGVPAALATLAATGPAAAQGLDEAVNSVFASSTGWFVSFIFSSFPGTSFPWIVGWLVVAATIFTIYFGFIQFRGFKHSIELVRSDYLDPKDASEVTPFQALATALSGTDGRRTHGDLGLWEVGQVNSLKQIATFLSQEGAVPGIQLGHAGRKASERRP